MTNYMGVTRLKKIIHNYLTNVKGISENLEKENIYYICHKRSGVECLIYFRNEEKPKTIYVCGRKAKTVKIGECRYDISSENLPFLDCIITHYDENFNPLPNETYFSREAMDVNAKEKSDCNFEKIDETEANKYVCFDIAKKQQNNDSDFVEDFQQSSSTEMTEVFDNIHTKCKNNNMTIEELTKKAGIERKTFHNWEYKKDMPLSALKKFADILNVSTDKLLGLEVPKTAE